MKRALTFLFALVAWASLALAQSSVTIGLNQDPPRLDPTFSSATSELPALRIIFDNLVDYDKEFKPIPAVARSWRISQDGLTYTFTLNRGIKFHDGTDLDAAAVKFSLDRHRLTDGSFQKNNLSSIKEVRVVDPVTVQVVLAKPFGPLLAVLGGQGGMIVSPAAVQRAGANFENGPVGSGPYRFVSRRTQDNITLEANRSYWRGAPKVDRIIFRPFPDGTVRLANLLSGAVNLILPVEPKDVEGLQKNDKFKVSVIPTVGFRGIWYNTSKPPFNNKALREAVDAVIDRDVLSRVVFFNLEPGTASPFPSFSPAYIPTITVKKPDIELARRKLREAGVSNFSFTLTTIARSPEREYTQAIQAMAAAAGITVRIDAVDVGEYLRRNNALEHEAVTFQWSGGPDPDNNMYDHFVTKGPFNWAGYSNKDVDAALMQGRETTNMITRRNLYGRALYRISQDRPFSYLTQQSARIGMQANIEGVEVFPDGIMRLAKISLK